MRILDVVSEFQSMFFIGSCTNHRYMACYLLKLVGERAPWLSDSKVRDNTGSSSLGNSIEQSMAGQSDSAGINGAANDGSDASENANMPPNEQSAQFTAP